MKDGFVDGLLIKVCEMFRGHEERVQECQSTILYIILLSSFITPMMRVFQLHGHGPFVEPFIAPRMYVARRLALI